MNIGGPVLPHCGNGFEEISGCAWLMLKFDEARQLAFKAGGRFITKEEFLAAPQYSIAVTALTLVFLMQRRMPFAHLILGAAREQNASPKGSARGDSQPFPNTKNQVHELRIASKG
jgi:hypothetical protein